MATTDANGLVILEGADVSNPLENAINLVTASVSNKFDAIDPQQIHYVADIPERTTLAGTFSPTPAKPLYVHRQNAGTGLELEVTTDGTNWQTLRTFGAGQPFAMAAGSVTFPPSTINPNASAPPQTFSFPAGRFTVNPIVSFNIFGLAGGTVGMEPRLSGVSTTGGTMYLTNVSGSARTNAGNLIVWWTAIQMTPSSAEG